MQAVCGQNRLALSRGNLHAMMPCKAHSALICLVVLLGSVQMLASCGQKGDLFLPEAAPQTVPGGASPNAPGVSPEDVPEAAPEARSEERG